MPKTELDESIHKRLKNLGLIIRELRKHYGLNIMDASKDMDINRNTLGNVERGVGDFSVSTLFKIADFYGLPVSILLKGIEDDF